MMSPKKAYVICLMKYPGLNFDGNCVDYRDYWVFPFSNSDKMFTFSRIFIDKKTGRSLINDPTFNIEIWSKSKSIEGLISSGQEKVISRIGKRLGNDSGSIPV